MLSALKMGEGGLETRNVGGHTELEKDRYSLLEPPKGMQPCQHFEFYLVSLCWTSDLQNCRLIHLCCLSLQVCGNLLEQQSKNNALSCKFVVGLRNVNKHLGQARHMVSAVIISHHYYYSLVV